MKKAYDKTIIEPDTTPVLRGPELPPLALNNVPADLTIHGQTKWCQRTVEWWDMWRRSPQAKLMGDTDWETMLEAAIIHNEIWRPRTDNKLTPNALVQLLAELRQRVSAFGATWEDRQKLRLSIEVPVTQEEAEARIAYEAQNAVNYVERLTKLAAEAKTGGDEIVVNDDNAGGG